MKQVILLVTLLLVLLSLNAQAQATKTGAGSGSSATNSTNASTVGSAATNDPGAIGNDRTGNRKVRISGSTVDGSNGSATNDGASGQSGSPAPLPSFSIKQTNSRNNGRTKRSTSKVKPTSQSSSGGSIRS